MLTAAVVLLSLALTLMSAAYIGAKIRHAELAEAYKELRQFVRSRPEHGS